MRERREQQEREAAAKASDDSADGERPIKRHEMKKVDSVLEAATLGHMAAHSNIYPPRGGQGGRRDSVDTVVMEAGMRTMDAVMRSYSGGNWGDREPHHAPIPAGDGKVTFEIGNGYLPRHDSIEEENEEGKEQGKDNLAYE